MKLIKFIVTLGCLWGTAMSLQAQQVCNASIAASTPSAEFTDHGNGTVTHNRTGLMWERCSEGTWNAGTCAARASIGSWDTALKSAVSATTAGYSDWRLPNIKELQSIVEERCYAPAINESIFPNTPASAFWSASAYADNSDYAWVVGFGNGGEAYVSDFVRYGGYRVRLVRAGQPFGAFDALNAVGNSQASFVFDPVPNQLASLTVPVLIRAVDAGGALQTGFNASVPLLGLNGAAVVPSALQFANGVAQTNVRYLGSGVAQFTAQYRDAGGTLLTGSSNQFFLQMVGDPRYTVQGRTVPGASVQLTSSTAASIFGPVTADGAGKFVFQQVPVGQWRVQAALANYVQVCPDNDCSIIVNGNLSRVQTWLHSKKRPVILIPGVMGSTLSRDALGKSVPRNVADHIVGAAPKLPKKTCEIGNACDLRAQLVIYDPTQTHGWFGVLGGQSDGTAMGSSLLIADLEAAGFEVYPTPWDWRHPFKEAAQIYLKPKIDEVLAASGWPYVDVVAHSMGGLVTRSYIEDLGLGHNIDRFVMLGTPNSGSTNAYYLMQGGDPLALDNEVNDWRANGVADAAVYTAATNELWRTYKGEDMLDGLSNDGNVQNDSTYKKGITTRGIKEFLNKQVKGGQDLLPTYRFLYNGTLQPNPGWNSNLIRLNSALDFASHYDTIGVRMADGRVQAQLLLSNSESTLGVLGYSQTNVPSGTYPDGTPTRTYREEGDGTVVASQGAGWFPAAVVETGDFSSHPAMVGNARQRVLYWLTKGRSMAPAGALRALATAAAAAVPTSIATIDIDGQYAGLLTASDGARAGTVAGAEGIYEEIANSGVSVTPYQLHIAQGSPVNGTYRLQLTADSVLANTAARVSLAYLQPDVNTQRESVRILVKAVPYLADIVQDSAALRWMTLVDPVKPPLALKARPLGGLSQLNWTAPADASVTGYRIYYRPLADPRFVLLGQTGGTSFTTSVGWAADYDSANEFVVLSVNAAGVESPIRGGNSARNVSFARAAFTATQVNANGVVVSEVYPLSVNFTDRSDATDVIQSWAWDFNGDGVVDSTAQNPVFSFALPGSYSVSLTVTSADGSVDTKVFQNFVDIRTLTVPDAPSILSITPGPGRLTIVLLPPGNTGGGAIVSYSATCGASAHPSVTASSATTTVVVPGLVPGVSYTCTATASNGSYTSLATPASAPFIPKPKADLTPILMLLLD